MNKSNKKRNKTTSVLNIQQKVANFTWIPPTWCFWLAIYFSSWKPMSSCILYQAVLSGWIQPNKLPFDHVCHICLWA